MVKMVQGRSDRRGGGGGGGRAGRVGNERYRDGEE